MIGIFDSGSGGLTVATKITKLLPQTDVVYIGDTKNMPYGNKSQQELIQLTETLINFLIKKNCTTLVSACNSISSQVILTNTIKCNIPIIEMVLPTIHSLKRYTNKKVALVATQATIASGMYQQECKKNKQYVHFIANRHLASAIEHNDAKKISQEIKKVISNCLKNNCNVLSLSCTHYPLVITEFNKEIRKLPKPITIFDPSAAVAHVVKTITKNAGSGTFHAYTTSYNQNFSKILQQKLPHATHEVISL